MKIKPRIEALENMFVFAIIFIVLAMIGSLFVAPGWVPFWGLLFITVGGFSHVIEPGSATIEANTGSSDGGVISCTSSGASDSGCGGGGDGC